MVKKDLKKIHRHIIILWIICILLLILLFVSIVTQGFTISCGDKVLKNPEYLPVDPVQDMRAEEGEVIDVIPEERLMEYLDDLINEGTPFSIVTLDGDEFIIYSLEGAPREEDLPEISGGVPIDKGVDTGEVDPSLQGS